MCCDSFACAMTRSRVPSLIRVCHDSFTCAMTHSCVTVEKKGDALVSLFVIGVLQCAVVCCSGLQCAPLSLVVIGRVTHLHASYPTCIVSHT